MTLGSRIIVQMTGLARNSRTSQHRSSLFHTSIVNSQPRMASGSKKRFIKSFDQESSTQPKIIEEEQGSETLPKELWAEYEIEERKMDSVEGNKNDEDADWYVDKGFDENATTANEGKDSSLNENYVPRWLQGVQIAQERALGVESENAEMNGVQYLTMENSEGMEGSTNKFAVRDVVMALEPYRTSRSNDIEIVHLDLSEKTNLTNDMVIVQGHSKRHLMSMAESVKTAFKRKFPGSGIAIQGINVSDDWLTIDLDYMIMHFMTAECRQYYDLEGLWTSSISTDPFLHVSSMEENQSGATEEGDAVSSSPSPSLLRQYEKEWLDGMGIDGGNEKGIGIKGGERERRLHALRRKMDAEDNLKITN